MNIEIRDIGKIEHADVTLDGITVIAGENNTGKSTIGKTVFAVFNALRNWQQKYVNSCSRSIDLALNKLSEELETFCMDKTNAKRRRTNRVGKLIEDLSYNQDFIAYIEDYKYSEVQEQRTKAHQEIAVLLSKLCIDYVGAYQKTSQELINEHKSFFDAWIEKVIVYIEDNIELDERVMQGNVIRKSFSDCFKSQFVREDKNNAFINIKIDDKKYTIKLKNMDIDISAPIRFDKNVYFIESPKLFDEIGSLRSGCDAEQELQSIMVPNSFLSAKRMLTKRRPFGTEFEDTVENTPEDLTEILKMLQSEMGGYAHYYVKEGIKFKDSSLKNPIPAQNVSTGLKAMAFLEYALRMGAIQKGDILILDEPEINLHPDWQVSYARALVLLHQKYDLTLLITSHSPYFIRAIECFSDKYDVMDKLNVYLVAQDEDGKQRIDNVMESEYGMTELYDKLSAPLDSLQYII
ncbi:MAG: ATP-binding protein [Lachnospiraceae bacterium]|nr:ATP-binding protein [Lachnospiraceae bacterium]